MTRYREAHMLMAYVCARCAAREVIYNARDGVTPYTVACRITGCGGAMRHVRWSSDVHAPDHVPAIGDLMFLDTAYDTLLAAKRQYVAQMWDDPTFPMRTHPALGGGGLSMDACAKYLADEEMAEHEGHVPSLVTQTRETYLAMKAEKHG